MSRRPCRWCLGAALVSSAALLARAAAGEEPRDACFDSYVQAQRLRNTGKLRDARERLRACVQPTCPAFVRKDCSAWLDDVEARTPAVVVSVGTQGTADTRLAIFIDGERASDWTDGRAVPVDPGPHQIRAELDGHSVEQHIVVPEGNKTFPVVIDTEALAPPAPAPADTEATPGKEAPKPWLLRLPTPTYVLGGVAVVGLASFVGFALAGESVQSCAPGCSTSQVSTLRRDYAVADVSLLTALAAGGGAVYFALTSTREASGVRSAVPRTTAWWMGVRVEAGGPWLGGGASF